MAQFLTPIIQPGNSINFPFSYCAGTQTANLILTRDALNELGITSAGYSVEFRDPTIAIGSSITYPLHYGDGTPFTNLVLDKTDLAQLGLVPNVRNGLVIDGTGTIVEQGGTLVRNTEIPLAGYNLTYTGALGRVAVGVLPTDTIDSRFTVKYDTATTGNNAVFAMIQNPNPGLPYFGMYTFTWNDHIGYANYLVGSGTTAMAGYYGENRWDTIRGYSIALEQRAGGDNLQANAQTKIAYSSTLSSEVPASIAAKHYGQGYLFTIWAFDDQFDTNYGKWL